MQIRATFYVGGLSLADNTLTKSNGKKKRQKEKK